MPPCAFSFRDSDPKFRATPNRPIFNDTLATSATGTRSISLINLGGTNCRSPPQKEMSGQWLLSGGYNFKRGTSVSALRYSIPLNTSSCKPCPLRFAKLYSEVT